MPNYIFRFFNAGSAEDFLNFMFLELNISDFILTPYLEKELGTITGDSNFGCSFLKYHLFDQKLLQTG